jgi:hypothetical protein
MKNIFLKFLFAFHGICWQVVVRSFLTSLNHRSGFRVSSFTSRSGVEAFISGEAAL